MVASYPLRDLVRFCTALCKAGCREVAACFGYAERLANSTAKLQINLFTYSIFLLLLRSCLLGIAVRSNCSLLIPPRKKDAYCVRFRGGDKRVRTADLLNAIQALYQLSYTPKRLNYFSTRGKVCQLFAAGFEKYPIY